MDSKQQMPAKWKLELTHVSKTFPGVKAVVDVSFSLRSGEVHALLGENGEGKSTLVKAVTGVQPPDPGAVIMTIIASC